MEIRKKIKNHKYASDYEFDEEGINILLKHGCKCQICEKSIFELYDFPNVGKLSKEDIHNYQCSQLEDVEVICQRCEYEIAGQICDKCGGEFTPRENTGIFTKKRKYCSDCY